MRIDINNLAIGYSANNPIVSDINVQVHANEFICLIGSNGIGKSTLQKTILGLISPLKGNIAIMDKNIADYSVQEKARMMSAVLSTPNNNCDLTVEELIGLGRMPFTNWFGKLNEKDSDLINSVIEKLHLSKLKNKRFADLSDGEKQKTMIAKAIVQETPIIVLDEPTAHLDLPTRFEINKLLKQLASNGKKTIISSTHDIGEALNADKIWMMCNNELISGTPEDLILSKEINKLFPTLIFDHEQETFTLPNRESANNITILGEGCRAKWTRHAVERCAINATATINVNENSWTIDNGKDKINVNSIQDLLKILQ